MEWSGEQVTRLRSSWAAGAATAEIGRQFGVSKNAIVGKAHRLDLPARPDPINRTGIRRPHVARPPPPPLPPLESEAAHAEAPKPVIAAPPPKPPEPAFLGRVVTCCWPIGHPNNMHTFRFCGADSVPGKPYCSDHAQLAYVRVRDRREDEHRAGAE